MVVELFVIFDKTAQECGPVFQAKNAAVAQRNFRQVLEKVPDPGEFQLLRVGVLDTELCRLDQVHPAADVTPSVAEDVRRLVREAREG